MSLTVEPPGLCGAGPSLGARRALECRLNGRPAWKRALLTSTHPRLTENYLIAIAAGKLQCEGSGFHLHCGGTDGNYSPGIKK